MGVLVGESSVCGGRLVAWRTQPYENAGAKAYEICDVILSYILV